MQAQAGRVIPVKMGEFGKISPKIEQDFGYSRIETHWVRDTVAIALIKKAQNECLLIHPTPQKVQMLEAALVHADFSGADKCVIAASMHSSKHLLSEILAFASTLTQDIQLTYFSSIASLGYSLSESIYYPDAIDPRVLTHSTPELLAAQDSSSNMLYVNWTLTNEPVHLGPNRKIPSTSEHKPLGLMRIVR
ncbi:MAG: hypothetical protein QXU54_01060 [Candidatus Micrarchaeia archaeon]